MPEQSSLTGAKECTPSKKQHEDPKDPVLPVGASSESNDSSSDSKLHIHGSKSDRKRQNRRRQHRNKLLRKRKRSSSSESEASTSRNNAQHKRIDRQVPFFYLSTRILPQVILSILPHYICPHEIYLVGFSNGTLCKNKGFSQTNRLLQHWEFLLRQQDIHSPGYNR